MKCQIENLKRNNSGMNKTNTMNRIRIHLILFSLLMAGITCYSQSPNLISYQTVIRNGNNELVSNTTIGVRISILGGPEANVLVYQEEHTVKTNINGLAYLTIGNGKILNGLITSIDWSKGPYFIKSETDPTGGKNYSIVVLSQMLSVPYAIYSSTAEKLTGTLPETDPVFNGSIAKGITATDTSYWNKKLNTSDTSRMLANYLKKSEAITTGGVETDPVFNGSIAKGITATDTSYWNKKLNSTDTSGMLANYRTGLNQKLNITDTAKMLVPYLRDADTTNMLANYRTSINNKLDAKDTTLMLSNYLKKSEGLNESDPLFNVSIAKGITATDTSYWNKKLNSTDTSGMLTNYRTGLNQKLNITDTTKMLVPYLRDADTTNMLANYRTSINNKLDVKDTTLMLSNYLKKSEGLNESDPLFNVSIAKGITATDTSYWNKKLNSTDTSGMLANYKNTLNSKAPINNPTFTGTVSGIDKNMIGLGNVDNTSDVNKPISLATQSVINGKVNIADTAAMLANYLKKSDSLYSNLDDLIEQINLLKILTNYPVIDGYNYKFVKIGNQIWFSENLRTTKYRNGDNIPTNLDIPTWSSATYGAYSIYNDKDSLGNIYGNLYNWFAVVDGRGICPAGWHVATGTDWSILLDFLGGGNTAGGKLRNAGTTFWPSPNLNSTNESGFNVIPGGVRGNDGSYGGLGGGSWFFTPDEYVTGLPWLRTIDSGPAVQLHYHYRQNGMYVRCVKDN